MKKSLVILLSGIILISSLLPAAVSADVSFPDLGSGHWAYSYIMKLVSDGTIKGYEDGRFIPDNMVTRAEFVKMIGEGSTVRSAPYADVAANHWGYSYIMSSGLAADSAGNFNPSVPITRETVIELLWTRNGKQTGLWAPYILTKQGKNDDAIAWAYSFGLMQGDDGVNLRLSDGIKRSEAAALIVRAREINQSAAKKTFEDVVNPDVIKNAYNALGLLEGEYSPEKAVTNGEMARAALMIGCEEATPTYQGLVAVAPFEHKYAKDLYVLGRYSVGEDKITESYADAQATYEDTIAFLGYNFIRKSSKGYDLSKSTEALKGKVSNNANAFLTFAENYGIFNYEGKDLSQGVTQKDFMTLVILFDAVIGTQSDITTDIHSFTNKNITANHSLALSASAQNTAFKVTLADMPSSLYTTDFEIFGDDVALPKDVYEFTRGYNIIFMGMLQKYEDAVKAYSGTDVRFTFYPSLCCKNGNGYTLRVKCEIISLSGTKTLAEIFPACSEQVGMQTANQGDAFYLDFETGVPVTSMDMPIDAVYIGQLIK